MDLCAILSEYVFRDVLDHRQPPEAVAAVREGTVASKDSAANKGADVASAHAEVSVDPICSLSSASRLPAASSVHWKKKKHSSRTVGTISHFLFLIF